MSDYNDNKKFLKIIFDHILRISRGDCSIEYSEIEALEEDHPDKSSILQGLKFLHEDLTLYKNDLRQKMETEYKLKMLEKENHELEQFNYIASHDMKEPLRTIKNFSDLLKRQYSSQLDEKANEYLNFIGDSSNRMYNLIQGLLNLSKVNDFVEKEKVNCNHLVENIIQDLSKSIEEKKAQVKFDKLPIIEENPLALRQLFINLISNGIKYKSPDRDPVINISHTIEGKHHSFSVSDNGLGIEKEYQKQIFELFTRLHTKSKIEGTGIGLSVCKKIVDSLGGDIWVESEYGQGSTFRIKIPKHTPVSAQAYFVT